MFLKTHYLTYLVHSGCIATLGLLHLKNNCLIRQGMRLPTIQSPLGLVHSDPLGICIYHLDLNKRRSWASLLSCSCHLLTDFLWPSYPHILHKDYSYQKFLSISRTHTKSILTEPSVSRISPGCKLTFLTYTQRSPTTT